ncbi:MAG: CpaF family protein [Bacilli bacterium]|nr:CpaF family protein [Bacilli bacterium]
MARNSLIKEFNYELNFDYNQNDLNNVFKNKEELDILRKNILGELGSLSYANEKITKELILDVISNKTKGYNLSNLERNHLYNVINEEISGYGPLSSLLKDPNVEEIMVNSYNEIYALVDGNIIRDTSLSFINNEHVMRTIKKMLSSTNIIIDSSKVIETTLPDGSFLSVILPPISKRGPILSIKKFNPMVSNIDELIKLGTLTPYMARFLDAAIKAKLNIIVTGGSKSGKTSLLSALANIGKDNSRLITISDNEDLNINKENVVHLTKNENIIKTALNIYPNTLIINNLTSDLVADSIDVMIDNSINVLESTKSNNALEVINFLETSYCEAKGLSSKIARETLYNAVDLIVTISKLSDNKHRITSILELNKNNNNAIVLKEIFAFKTKGLLDNGSVNGEFIMYNYRPRAYRKIKRQNIDSIDDIFENIK